MLCVPGQATACVNLVSICKFFKQDRYLDRYFSHSVHWLQKKQRKKFFLTLEKVKNYLNNSVSQWRNAFVIEEFICNS